MNYLIAATLIWAHIPFSFSFTPLGCRECHCSYQASHKRTLTNTRTSPIIKGGQQVTDKKLTKLTCKKLLKACHEDHHIFANSLPKNPCDRKIKSYCQSCL